MRGGVSLLGYPARMSGPRTTAQRRADTIALLERHGHGWLATADPGAAPHLIVVTAVWTGSALIVATRGSSPTARNLGIGRRARVGLGEPEDVVMVDAVVEETAPATRAGSPLATAFVPAAGWDPAEEGDDWRYLRLRPIRIQAYRGYGEHRGSDVMRDGAWLD